MKTGKQQKNKKQRTMNEQLTTRYKQRTMNNKSQTTNAKKRETANTLVRDTTKNAKQQKTRNDEKRETARRQNDAKQQIPHNLVTHEHQSASPFGWLAAHSPFGWSAAHSHTFMRGEVLAGLASRLSVVFYHGCGRQYLTAGPKNAGGNGETGENHTRILAANPTQAKWLLADHAWLYDGKISRNTVREG